MYKRQAWEGEANMAKQVILTEEGLAALENELEELKSVKRKEIAEKIKVALSFGDLSENSEYDEAKNDQAMIEARIADIEAMLKNATIIDESELGTDVRGTVDNPVVDLPLRPDGKLDVGADVYKRQLPAPWCGRTSLNTGRWKRSPPR